jgi:hypothetical protein
MGNTYYYVFPILNDGSGDISGLLNDGSGDVFPYPSRRIQGDKTVSE